MTGGANVRSTCRLSSNNEARTLNNASRSSSRSLSCGVSSILCDALCMGALTEPRLNSFFACGDFNQRITEFGITSKADIAPFFPDIDIRTVEITYRHTRQLSEFAKAIIAATSRSGTTVALPENVNNEGFKPVIGRNLAGAPVTAEWLARRIFEIEKTSETLPSIAVLVNSEEAAPLFS